MITKMNRRLLIALSIILCPFSITKAPAAPLSLDSIASLLANAPVQEKVWLHLDNTCYFKGDTIWYKSYVVRADNLGYSDMSRLVYVELVSPDGLVVERHQLIASEEELELQALKAEHELELEQVQLVVVERLEN